MIATVRIVVNSTTEAWTPTTAQNLVTALNSLIDTAAADSSPSALYTALQAGGFTLGTVYFQPGTDNPTNVGEGARRFTA